MWKCQKEASKRAGKPGNRETSKLGIRSERNEIWVILVFHRIFMFFPVILSLSIVYLWLCISCDNFLLCFLATKLIFLSKFIYTFIYVIHSIFVRKHSNSREAYIEQMNDYEFPFSIKMFNTSSRFCQQ